MWLNWLHHQWCIGCRITIQTLCIFFFFFPQATVVCDLVLLYLLPKREFYKNMKFKYTDTHAQVRPCSRFVAISPRTQGGGRECKEWEPRQGQICYQQRRFSSDHYRKMGGRVGLSCTFNNRQKQLQPTCLPNTHPIAVSAERSDKTITK